MKPGINYFAIAVAVAAGVYIGNLATDFTRLWVTSSMLAQVMGGTPQVTINEPPRSAVTRGSGYQAQVRKEITDAQMREAFERASGNEPGKMGEYLRLMHDHLMKYWQRPVSMPKSLSCQVRIQQRRNGSITGYAILRCPHEATRASIERAVKHANPLPLASSDELFSTQVLLVIH